MTNVEKLINDIMDKIEGDAISKSALPDLMMPGLSDFLRLKGIEPDAEHIVDPDYEFLCLFN